jgi:hypothetical protein
MRDSETKQETDPAKGHYGLMREEQITRKQIGVEHPEMLRSMSNLALVLDQQGIYEKAEEMHRQALEASLVVSP